MARKYKKRKITKKDWVTEQLDDYYSRKGIAASVRETKVDWSRYNESVDVTEIYERYHINQFTSQEEFKEYYIKKGLVDDRLSLPKREQLLKKMWNDYVKREQLMFTGQYEEIRTQVFKDNYIKALVAIGAPRYVIEELEKATLDKWKTLATTPDTDKTSLSDTKLPHLGGFAYSTKGDNERAYDMEKIVGDVIRAAREAGIYIMEKFYDMEYADEAAFRQEEQWRNEEIERMAPVIRFIPKEARESLEDLYTEYDVRQAVLSTLPVRTKAGRLRTRISKKGNIYIPFIGSQGSARSRELISEIVSEFERRGLDLADIVEGWDEHNL